MRRDTQTSSGLHQSYKVRSTLNFITETTLLLIIWDTLSDQIHILASSELARLILNHIPLIKEKIRNRVSNLLWQHRLNDIHTFCQPMISAIYVRDELHQFTITIIVLFQKIAKIIFQISLSLHAIFHKEMTWVLCFVLKHNPSMFNKITIVSKCYFVWPLIYVSGNWIIICLIIGSNWMIELKILQCNARFNIREPVIYKYNQISAIYNVCRWNVL